jgi:hypothetical protein
MDRRCNPDCTASDYQIVKYEFGGDVDVRRRLLVQATNPAFARSR